MTRRPIVSDELTCGLIADLWQKRGFPSASSVPGIITREIGDGWVIGVNGHGEALEVEPEHCMGAKLEPYEFGVWRNGWWLGALRPYVNEQGQTAEQGVLIGGGAEPDAALRAYLKKALNG